MTSPYRDKKTGKMVYPDPDRLRRFQATLDLNSFLGHLVAEGNLCRAKRFPTQHLTEIKIDMLRKWLGLTKQDMGLLLGTSLVTTNWKCSGGKLIRTLPFPKSEYEA